MSTVHACFTPDQPVHQDTMSHMLTASKYWQPDATSQASSRQQCCHLARASLFNTERSKRDTVHEDHATGCIISANARLDYRSDLGGKLGLSDNMLSQFTDSQLILKAYLRWGKDCPKYLLGDFVFIIWDESRQRLFCARDHFGVKVLFYSQNSHGVMVSNEHNSFFTANWQPRHIKECWLVRKLWGLGPEPVESPYAGIEVLPPAHSMMMDDKGITTSRYWSLEDKNDWQAMDDKACIEELKQRFQTAVKARLDSAFPLGAELSEGLDSNGIAGYAAHMLGKQPLYTFSYSCERLTNKNRSVWEETYQDIFDMLAMHDNLKPVWITSQANDQHEQTLAAFYRHNGGVMAINGGHFLRSRLAREQGARVLLSGWGGDHCVSTYGDFYESELFTQGKWLSAHRLLRDKHKRGRGAKPARAWTHLLLKHATPRFYRGLLRRRGGLEQALWRRTGHSPLKQSYISRYGCQERLRQFTDNYQRNSVKAHHRRELFDVGVEGRLVESELCGRMFRVEYRYPMLDVPLVELAYNLPPHLKMHYGMERYMFRRVLEGVTTKRIQLRLKADVDHPQFDHDGERKDVAGQLVRQLLNSDLARRYYDRTKLEALARTDVSLCNLKGFQLLLSIERQLRETPSKIID